MTRPVPVESASALIDEKVKELGDWRGKTLAKVREIIHEADPEIVEEWKWVKPTSPGTPVWVHGGIVCTGETYKNVVKMTFPKGAALKDPSGQHTQPFAVQLAHAGGGDEMGLRHHPLNGQRAPDASKGHAIEDEAQRQSWIDAMQLQQHSAPER